MADAGSFTQRILSEVAPHSPPLACCRGALVRGMRLCASDGIRSHRTVAMRAALQALHQLGIEAHVVRVAAARRAHYRIDMATTSALPADSGRPCCARSLLRGAFLATGLVNRPTAAVHLEISAADEPAALQMLAAAARLDIEMAMVRRRGHALVVARSVDSVAAVLSSIGAQSARLDFEEGRVVREVRAGVNRRLNAETANLARTVAAGVGQIAAIEALRADAGRWETLPAALREAADVRLRHPGESLDGLARMVGISRSAMAGRLHRIVAMADT